MKNDDFRRVWTMLDRDIRDRCGDDRIGMSALNAVGMINVAERMREELDRFCTEIVARSKGRLEMEKMNEEAMRQKVGEAYDSIPAEYSFGLHVEPKKPA